jgi:TonB family protein
MRAVQILLLAVGILEAAAAIADEPKQPVMIQNVTAGEQHEIGEARWTSVVLGQLSDVCRLTGADRKIELGEKASPEPRANADDCIASGAFVHNTSEHTLNCRATLTVAQPDDTGRTEVTGQRTIIPRVTERLATVYGDKANAPSTANTHCEVSNLALPPPPGPCDMKVISAPDPDLFYPALSRRLEEWGDVIINFRVDSSTKKLRDLRVSESSGYPLLDVAALEVGREMRATSNCPDLRRSIKVKFRIRSDEPAPPPPPPAS